MIGDFVKATLPYFDVCISNTPYQISSPLVFRLLSHRPLFRVAILMFQREFATRLVAQPGTALWSRLSANVQLYAKVDLVMNVSKNNFRPPPQVDSSVVRIEPKLGSDRPHISFVEWDGMLRVCFNRRNKTLRASWLGNKEVLAMVERNYRLWCATNDIPVDDTVADEDEDEGGHIDSEQPRVVVCVVCRREEPEMGVSMPAIERRGAVVTHNSIGTPNSHFFAGV